MANQSIYDAFERLWEHTKAKLSTKSDTGHTHNYAGSSSAGGSANSVKGKLNIEVFSTSSSPEGGTSSTSSYNYNGNEDLTINLSLLSSEHTHSASYITSGTLGVARGGTGQTSAINAANSFLNALGTGSSTPQDADYYISQYVGGGTTTTTYHRRPMSALWSYIAGKADSRYLKLTGGNLSGSISVVKSDATVAQFHAKNSLRQGSLYISEVGNLGIYDRTNSQWVIRSDTSKNIYFGQPIAGTMWGPGVSSSWYNGRDKAKLRVTSQNGYSPALSLKTKKGSWDIGSYSGSINSGYGNAEGSGTSNWLLFNFLPDANYTNALNSPLGRICFSENGMIWSYAYYISTNGSDNLASVTEFGIDTFEDTYEIIESQAEGVIVGKTIFGPYNTKTYNLGNSNYRWKQLYATTTTINTSDRNLKKDFRTFDSDDRYTQFFMDLKPMIFKMKDGESGRDHFGFIAQDVEDSLLNLGYTSLDFAGLCKDAKCIPQQKPTKEERRNKKFKFQEELPLDLDENGNVQYEYSLRYQEFISLNTYMIQKLYNKIESLENEIKLLKKG